MGGSSSKESHEDKGRTFVNKIKTGLEDEIARKAMIQREVQMAVKIAQMRDTLCIFGTAYATFVTGVVTAKALGRAVPPVAGVPVVIGGLVLGNIADMAYGNKLNRVVKEAEYMLDNERGRFVPFRQAPFAKYYTEDEKKTYYDEATAVGDLWPTKFLLGRPPKQD